MRETRILPGFLVVAIPTDRLPISGLRAIVQTGHYHASLLLACWHPLAGEEFPSAEGGSGVLFACPTSRDGLDEQQALPPGWCDVRPVIMADDLNDNVFYSAILAIAACSLRALLCSSGDAPI